MIAGRLLERLEGVRQSGRDRWMAKCPAHLDRHPSLSIALGEDGRLLIHCFAGCQFDAVVQAVGLEVADFFPPKEGLRYRRQQRMRVNPADALAYLIHATRIVMIVAADIRRGERISEQDWATFDEAMRRVGVIEELLNG